MCEGLNYFLKSWPLWSYHSEKFMNLILIMFNFHQLFSILAHFVFTPQISLPVDFFSTDSRRPGHHHYHDHDHLHSSFFSLHKYDRCKLLPIIFKMWKRFFGRCLTKNMRRKIVVSRRLLVESVSDRCSFFSHSFLIFDNIFSH